MKKILLIVEILLFICFLISTYLTISTPDDFINLNKFTVEFAQILFVPEAMSVESVDDSNLKSSLTNLYSNSFSGIIITCLLGIVIGVLEAIRRYIN